REARELLLYRGRVDPDVRAAAIAALSAALLHTDAPDGDYTPAVELLADLFEDSERPREALTLGWYRQGPRHGSPLLARVPAVDRARTFALWAQTGRRSPLGDSHALNRRAAEEFEQAGFLARAAIHYELAQNFASARVLWARFADQLDALPEQEYAAG